MGSLPLVLLGWLAVTLLVATCAAQAAAVGDSAHTLPIFFFHGVTASAQAGYYLQQNLQSETRPFIPLNFCEKECSVRDLPTQVTMAIAQIRSITSNDTRFDRGYVVIGHSQGGVLARAVIEEMDDHKVHTFISLAGAQNGNFNGPQPSDRVPTQVFIQALGPKMVPKELIDFANYTADQVASGKVQIDFLTVVNNQPTLQQKLSVVNLLRSPVRADWLRVNQFMPKINNMQLTASTLRDRLRRKRNFLRLKAAHFFASPADDVISPWQTSVFGQYSEVASMEALAVGFSGLTVVSMKDTHEYKHDTYGLRTLDHRRALFLHVVDGVSHSCWVADSTPFGSTEPCKFQPVFEKHIYPLLRKVDESPVQSGRDDQRQY